MISNERLVRGSIRVFKDKIFYEDRDVQEVNVIFEDLEATLHVTTIPVKLREIFDRTNIQWENNQRIAARLKSQVDGINYVSINPDEDEDYLRLGFEGKTRYAIKAKLKEAFDWLDEHGIKHGESNGNAACIFECITNKQLELPDQEE